MTCRCFAYFLRICQIYAGVVQIPCRYFKEGRTYLQNICERHADMVQIRTNPLQTKCSTVTDMWQIFTDILHICQFGKGSDKYLYYSL